MEEERKLKKYEWIANEIKAKIESGVYKEGEKLPSIRTLAEAYQCNKGTIGKSFEILEEAHLCYGIPKSGFYAIVAGEVPAKKRMEDAVYDFAQVAPLDDFIPYREFSHSMTKAIDKYAKQLFRYGQAEGMDSARQTLEKFLASHNIYTQKEDIVITSGALQGLDLLFRMMKKDQKVVVEQPTYNLIYKLASLNNVTLVGIARSEAAMDFKALEKAFKQADYFYTIPRLSNPLGLCYSETDKKHIVELAKKHEVLIIEDDYLGDLVSNSKNLPMHYYGMGTQVIYIKSFSKGFLPGVRLGCVVFPHEQVKLRQRLIKYKMLTDYGTSMYNQGALEIFIESGMYERHLEKIQGAYEQRMTKAAQFVESKCPENIVCRIPSTGIFIGLHIQTAKSKKLCHQLLTGKHVVFIDEETFYLEGWQEAHKPAEPGLFLRLCVTSMSMEEVCEGLEAIFEVFR